MHLGDLSSTVRDIGSGLTLVLAIACIFGIVRGFRQKNKQYVIFGWLVLFLSFAMGQIMKWVSEAVILGSRKWYSVRAMQIPTLIYEILLFLLCVCTLLLLQRCWVWDKAHVTPLAIKESIDFLPSGLVIYSEDGSCKLVNNKMNEISLFLTGRSALNGKELQEEIQKLGSTVDIDGKKYAFHHRQLEYDGEILLELTADDVTQLYLKLEELREKNEKLKENVKMMRLYGQTIDESVRQQEILQAKMNIHDEMNRLLLVTEKAALGGLSDEEEAEILHTWNNNALLLCKQADENPKSNTVSDMETLARVIGIDIVWEKIPDTGNKEALKLFERVTKEIMVNAVKHGKAKHLYIDAETVSDIEGGGLRITYRNDGLSAKEPIIMAGGLKNICGMLKKVGGNLELVAEPEFRIEIWIPIGGLGNGI